MRAHFTIVICLPLLLQAKPALALSCKPLFAAVAGGGKRVAVAARDYGREVARTRGLRLVLKPREADDAQARLAHFVRAYEGNRLGVMGFVADIGQWIPRKISKALFGKEYELTPIRGIVHNSLVRPTRFVTRKLTRREREPTLAVTMPVDLVLATLPLVLFGAFMDDQKRKRALERVEEHAPDWDRLIRSDFRYEALLDKLRAGELTPERARLAAAVYRRTLEDYLERRRAGAQGGHDQYLGLPMFADIEKLRDEGFTRPGFRRLEGFEEQPSEESIRRLVELRHGVLALQEIAWRWIHHPETVRNGEDAAVIETLRADSHVSGLLRLHEQGRLDRNELSFRIQEDLFWRSRFEEWKILKVEKLKRRGGQVIDEPLDIATIRAELMEEMGTLSSRK